MNLALQGVQGSKVTSCFYRGENIKVSIHAGDITNMKNFIPYTLWAYTRTRCRDFDVPRDRRDAGYTHVSPDY